MMNKILAIDTSSAKCSVALTCEGSTIQRTSELERQSAQRLLPMIEELLGNSQITLADLDLIAVMAGPGSFTGLRIGIGVAQGLSMANSTPVLALSSMAVIAMASIRESASPGVLVADAARGGELYFAAYKHSGKYGVELVGREQVCIPQRLEGLDEIAEIGDIASWNLTGACWANELDREAIEQLLQCKLAADPLQVRYEITDLCDLAQLRFAAGQATNAAELRPNYVKEQLDYL